MTKKENLEEQKDEVKSEEKSSENEIKKLKEELNHWKDLAMRTAAEMENLRKRCQIDMQNNIKYAKKDFAKDILPVVDNLESAIRHAKLETSKDVSIPTFFSGFLQGIEMTHKLVISALEKNNIKKMNDLGKPFDPEKHQVVQQVEDKEKDPGIILQELQAGYEIDDRVLREAMVVVSQKTDTPS